MRLRQRDCSWSGARKNDIQPYREREREWDAERAMQRGNRKNKSGKKRRKRERESERKQGKRERDSKGRVGGRETEGSGDAE